MTFELDAPLPAELTGRAHGWFTSYRRYPVFSRPWVRGRLRLVGSILAAVFAVMAPLMLADKPLDRPWPGAVSLALQLWVPALLGPWLGWQVRRRALPAAREGRALLAVLLALTAVMALYGAYAEEPVKDWVAQATGHLDEHGQRPKVQVVLGLSVTNEKGVPTEEGDADSAFNTVFNGALRATVALLLAGGAALRGWRREHTGLAALARERALADAQAARREAELRLSVLAAQVEPHFLFNTLAGVRSAIATDPARASDMIDRLVEYLRAAIPRLRSDGRAQATVAAQFDIVRAYLGLMAARMPRLSYEVSAEPGLLQARCPPLMLISLAENAVKHGVEAKIGPARVSVSAARGADGTLALTVADDGVGFGAAQSGTGLGLANIRERLAQLYGERAALTLKARPEGGVAATITLPLETA